MQDDLPSSLKPNHWRLPNVRHLERQRLGCASFHFSLPQDGRCCRSRFAQASEVVSPLGNGIGAEDYFESIQSSRLSSFYRYRHQRNHVSLAWSGRRVLVGAFVVVIATHQKPAYDLSDLLGSAFPSSSGFPELTTSALCIT